MRFSQRILSFLGVVYLCTSVAAGQREFPFQRDFDTIRGAKAAVLLGNRGAASLAFTPDSRYLVTRLEKTLTAWDIRNRKKVSDWKFERDITSFALTPNGKSLAVSGGMAVLLYDLETRKKLRSWVVPENYKDERVLQIVFNHRGTLLATATGVYGYHTPAGSIHVWEVATKGEKPWRSIKNVLNYQMHSPAIVFVLGKNRLLSSGGGFGDGGFGDGGKASFIDLDSGKAEPVESYRVKPGRVASCFAVSSNGRLSVVGTVVCEAGRDARMSELPADKNLRALAFGPRSRYLAAISNDESLSLLVWDVVRRTEEVVRFKERVMIRKLPGIPQAVAFSPDGASLAVATSKAVLLWDAPSLLPVTDPLLLNEDLREEIGSLRQRIDSLERRIKDLESRK